MDSTVQVTCFADLKDSTLLTEKLGQDEMRRYREEFLQVGQSLCELVGGNYIKNLGDGHLIIFESPESAFRFSMQLQQYYLPQPCYKKAPLKIRIGLFLGVVEFCSGDVFGSGVNQAARVEGKTQPGEILVNKDLVDAIGKVWAKVKTEKYLKSCGKFELKGIIDPPEQELFSFDWLAYGMDNVNDGLALLIFNHLQEASVIPSNLSIRDIAKPAFIIWPVVPRDLVNAIHRGQLEMIRLLTLAGWRVNVLIADCGISESLTREYSEEFRKKIEAYAEMRHMKDLKILLMRDLYKPRSSSCDKLHTYFQRVISDLTLDDLIGINKKDYIKEEQEKVGEKATLDFLRPALTIAAVLQLSEQLGGKCVVIVGNDEHDQWIRAHDIPGCRKQIGVLFNPVLMKKKKKGPQAQQLKNWPHWDSWHDMSEEMKKTNLASWTIQLHAFIPSFPRRRIKIGQKEVCKEDFEKIEEHVTNEVLAKHVFDNILSI